MCIQNQIELPICSWGGDESWNEKSWWKNPHQNEGKKKKECFKTQTKETKKEFEKPTFDKLAS